MHEHLRTLQDAATTTLDNKKNIASYSIRLIHKVKSINPSWRCTKHTCTFVDMFAPKETASPSFAWMYGYMIPFKPSTPLLTGWPGRAWGDQWLAWTQRPTWTTGTQLSIWEIPGFLSLEVHYLMFSFMLCLSGSTGYCRPSSKYNRGSVVLFECSC